MKEIHIKRRVLYDLVWSETLKEIAETHKITQVSIKRKSEKYNIPMPDLAYWNRKHLGQDVEIPELKGDGETKIVLYYKDEYGNHYIQQPNSEELRLAELKFLLSEIKPQKESLIKPSRLVQQLKQNLSVNRNTNRSWSDYKGVVNSSGNNLDTSVGENNTKRGLIVWEYLHKCLDNLGHSIQVTDRGTYIVSFGEPVKIHLKEKCVEERVKEGTSSWERRYLIPNGMLGFRLDDSYRLKEYYESKTTDIFEKIPAIISKVEARAKKEIEWRKECEISRLKSEKEKIEREKKEAIIRMENDKLNLLIDNAKRYQLVNLINQYIDGGNLDDDYIKWAKKKVDCINPNLDETDSILGKYNDWNLS